jgi:hypothetical protein
MLTNPEKSGFLFFRDISLPETFGHLPHLIQASRVLWAGENAQTALAFAPQTSNNELGFKS